MKTFVWTRFIIYVIGFVLNTLTTCAMPRRQNAANIFIIVFTGGMMVWTGVLLFGGGA